MYGDIFKSITNKDIPDTVEGIWSEIPESRKIGKPLIMDAGSNLTSVRGNIFPIDDLDNDIDKSLKKKY